MSIFLEKDTYLVTGAIPTKDGKYIVTMIGEEHINGNYYVGRELEFEIVERLTNYDLMIAVKNNEVNRGIRKGMIFDINMCTMEGTKESGIAKVLDVENEIGFRLIKLKLDKLFVHSGNFGILIKYYKNPVYWLPNGCATFYTKKMMEESEAKVGDYLYLLPHLDKRACLKNPIYVKPVSPPIQNYQVIIIFIGLITGTLARYLSNR